MTTEEKRTGIQEILDDEQIKEIRFALMLRRAKLEDLEYEERRMGMDGRETNRRIAVIEGLLDGGLLEGGKVEVRRENPWMKEEPANFIHEALPDLKGSFPGEMPTLEDIQSWPPQTRLEVIKWMEAAELEIEGVEGIEIPPVPAVLMGDWEEVFFRCPECGNVDSCRITDIFGGQLRCMKDDCDAVMEESYRIVHGKGEPEGSAIDPPFHPTPELIEETRAYLSKHGWPEEDWEAPTANLRWTIALVREVGWTRASLIAEGGDVQEAEEPKETAPEESIAPKLPRIGDIVKCESNRRYVFRVMDHAQEFSQVILQDARKKQVWPPVLASKLTWDGEYWVTDHFDPDDFLPIGEDSMEGPDEPEDDFSPEPEVLAGDDTDDEDTPDVADPVVVLREDDEPTILVVGPIEVIPPRYAKLLDPDRSPTDGYNGAVVGKAPIGEFDWDEDLDAWTVDESWVQWSEHTTEETTLSEPAHA